MTSNNVKYPSMRADLCSYLSSLSDVTYQNHVWVQGHTPTSRDSFGDIIHFLYDDTKLAISSSDCMNTILQNQVEAEHIASLILILDKMFEVYGLKLTDAEYVSKPEWKQVVELAAAAKQMICSAPDN